MYHFIHCFCSLLISMGIRSAYGLSTHALIGNYSENPKDCGITRLTNGFDGGCFKWHKSPMIKMIAGRNATIDEVPWVASIKYDKKAKAIPKYYKIELGYHSQLSKDKVYEVNVTKIVLHYGFVPNYWPRSRPPLNDLALFKIAQSIETIDTTAGQRVSTHLRSVCLPQEDISNTQEEYALNAGWGQVHRQVLPLQMGPKLIHAQRYPEWMPSSDRNRAIITDEHKLILTTSVENQTINCKGDSGGPLWQFNKGRAVLIGVASFYLPRKEPCDNIEKSATWFTKVSNYIDWIQYEVNRKN